MAVLRVRTGVGTGILFSLLFGCALALPALQDGRYGQRGQRGQREWGERDWSGHTKQERLDFLAKILAWRMAAPDIGPDGKFLNARAADLLERAKQALGNSFQFDRLAAATDSLLRASERISAARRANQVNENDRQDAALFLQKCYFRVQQAEYFAGISGEKEARQFVTLGRSLYQQARSAYDAHQYDRAEMLGDASSLIVMALENIAHAGLKIPDPPVIK
jgi:hypothetical protein